MNKEKVSNYLLNLYAAQEKRLLDIDRVSRIEVVIPVQFAGVTLKLSLDKFKAPGRWESKDRQFYGLKLNQQSLAMLPEHELARLHEVILAFTGWLDRVEAGLKRHEEEMNRQSSMRIVALETATEFSHALPAS